jgi:hypothetical protein
MLDSNRHTNLHRFFDKPISQGSNPGQYLLLQIAKEFHQDHLVFALVLEQVIKQKNAPDTLNS